MCLNNVILCVVVMFVCKVQSNPVMTNFNTSLREFAKPGDDANSTSVRTLQKEELARYANFAPVRSPIKFKEITDNALSSSSLQSRGLLHHEHNGYGLDYDDNQHYGHGGDYNLHEAGHGVDHHVAHVLGHQLGYGLGHGHGLYDHHHGHGHEEHSHHDHGHHETHLYHGDHLGHGGHGHHDKHLAHALAAKTIFWPIAGIALLGAAAALVSNPVLLQLGVVSGRRKRETEEATDFDPNSLTKWLKMSPLEIVTKTRTNAEKRVAHVSSVNVLKPPDDFEKRIIRDGKAEFKREAAIKRVDDILKIHRNNRLINVNQRISRKPPAADPVYVNQSDLPRTETYEDKHYVAIPLLANT